MKKISILMITYNDMDLAERTFKSIQKSNFSMRDIEVILFDNNSTKNITHLKDRVDKYIYYPRNIGSMGYTEAFKHASGKYILTCDSDLILDKDCLKRLYEAAEKDQESAFSPVFYDLKKNPLHNTIIYSKEFFYFQPHFDPRLSKTKPYPVLFGGIIFIKKDIIEKVGGMHDYFLYADDLYLGLRLRLTGRKMFWHPRAIVYMPKSESTARKIYLSEKNTLITFFRIMSFGSIIKYFPLVYGIRFVALLKDVLTFRMSCACARLMAIVVSLFSLKDRKIQKLRVSSDNKMLYDSNTKRWIRCVLNM